MKVRCIGVDARYFPIDQQGLEYFKTWFGKNTEPAFDHIEIGHTYVVHAIKMYSGFVIAQVAASSERFSRVSLMATSGLIALRRAVSSTERMSA
jgi:hypothetical protein